MARKKTVLIFIVYEINGRWEDAVHTNLAAFLEEIEAIELVEKLKKKNRRTKDYFVSYDELPIKI